MTNIFTAPTKESTSQQMADSLPQGRAWGKKNVGDSNTRLLINSLAVAHNSVQQQIQLMDEQFRIEDTTLMLEEWETSVGLPDECSSGQYPSIEQRRQDVITRIRKVPIVALGNTPETYSGSMQEYIDDKFPTITAILYAGMDYTSYPVGYSDLQKRHFVVIEVQLTSESFVYEFVPMSFTGGIDIGAITCIMSKFLPANVILLTYYT
jgi:hypothetical protein